MSEQDVLNDVMQLLEAAPTSRNPLIFLSRFLPTTFQNKAKSWLFLYPPVKQKRRSAPNLLKNRTPHGERGGGILQTI